MSSIAPTGPDEAFAELGKIVLGEQSLQHILERVVHIAQQILPPPVEVSVTVIAANAPATMAFTAEPALALDERQYEDETGPCLDCAAGGQLVVIKDMAAESRWPRFAASARDRGIGSSLSVPLPVQRELTGALNFYSPGPDAFDDQDIELGEIFAGQAAIAVANAHLYDSTAALAEQMRQAVETRAVIDQAKGIIMGKRRCSSGEAFAELVRLSQHSNVKLREVAQLLVDQVSGGGSATLPG